MKNIEISPENRIIGRVEAADLAMPGQLRIPKERAIANHIAQFWNDDRHGALAKSDQPTREKPKKPVKAHQNSETEEKQGQIRVLVETTIAISDALEIDLEKVRNGITGELRRREQKWMKEHGISEIGPRTGKRNDV